jgi:hypothetical protein
MPSAERYAQYRADMTTIWVSKRAAESLAREREPGEATAAAVDRLLAELRGLRRGGATGGGAKVPAKKAGAKKAGAKKGAAKTGAAKKGVGRRTGRVARGE